MEEGLNYLYRNLIRAVTEYYIDNNEQKLHDAVESIYSAIESITEASSRSESLNLLISTLIPIEASTIDSFIDSKLYGAALALYTSTKTKKSMSLIDLKYITNILVAFSLLRSKDQNLNDINSSIIIELLDVYCNIRDIDIKIVNKELIESLIKAGLIISIIDYIVTQLKCSDIKKISEAVLLRYNDQLDKLSSIGEIIRESVRGLVSMVMQSKDAIESFIYKNREQIYLTNSYINSIISNMNNVDQ